MKFAVATFVLTFALIVAGEDKRCGSSEDCAEDECCIVRRLGFFKGDCKKLAEEGQSCNQKDAKIKVAHGEQYVLFCPCSSGFNCEVTDVRELPFIGNVTIEQTCTRGAF